MILQGSGKHFTAYCTEVRIEPSLRTEGKARGYGFPSYPELVLSFSPGFALRRLPPFSLLSLPRRPPLPSGCACMPRDMDNKMHR